MRIVIASLPDREKVVAEIYDGDDQWAEVSHDHTTLIVELSPHPQGKPWHFSYDDLLNILLEANRTLRGDEHAGDG